MNRFIIGYCDEELTSNAGLGLIGVAIHKNSNLKKSLNKLPYHHGISHIDILSSYIGLLCLGKNDFEALENYRDDLYFQRSLLLNQIPSSARLRQRMDRYARVYNGHVEQATISFLKTVNSKVTAEKTGHVPIDMDVTLMDNSNSNKEGANYTYKGFVGYAPLAVYLGKEGYCLLFELREGKQHSQTGSLLALKRSINRACQITKKPLLLRQDAAHDDTDNFVEVSLQSKHHKRKIDFITKWNPRNKHRNGYWLNYAEKHGYFRCAEESTDGYRVAIFDIEEERYCKKSGRGGKYRRVMRVTEETIDRDGQQLLIPNIKVEGWWTSLNLSCEEVIELYNERGTSEQFHSEFKTDLDLERLPSGKFATNQLVLSCAVFAYNILRWIGQNGLIGKRKPKRSNVKRRRIRTVIQHLMYLAARLIKSGRRWKLSFNKRCLEKPIFEELYARLVYG